MQSRRDVLRGGATLVAAGVLGGLAGCSAITGGGGGSYANWVPEADDYGDRNHLSFTTIRPSDIAANEDAFSEDYFDLLEGSESSFDATGIDFEDVNSSTYFGSSSVLTGGFDGAAVREELEDNEYEEDDEVGGYRLYIPDGSSTPGRCWAVGGTVFGTRAVGDMDAVETAELLIETNGGDGSRQVDDSEPFGTLVDTVGAPTLGGGRTFDPVDDDEPEGGTFENSVARGAAVSVNGDSSDLTVAVVYEDADDVDTGDLEDWVDSNNGSGDYFDDVDDVSYNANGTVGTVSGTIDTDDLGGRYLN